MPLNWPWYAKIVGGIVGFGILYALFDLYNLLLGFMTLVVVPVMALYAVGLISEGTYEMFTSGDWIRDLNARRARFLEQLRAADPAHVSSRGNE